MLCARFAFKFGSNAKLFCYCTIKTFVQFQILLSSLLQRFSWPTNGPIACRTIMHYRYQYFDHTYVLIYCDNICPLFINCHSVNASVSQEVKCVKSRTGPTSLARENCRSTRIVSRRYFYISTLDLAVCCHSGHMNSDGFTRARIQSFTYIFFLKFLFGTATIYN